MKKLNQYQCEICNKEIFLTEMEKLFDWAAAELVEDRYVEV